MRATNAVGDSPWSTVKSVTMPGAQVPGKPTLEVDPNPLNHGKLLMSWGNPPNAAHLSHFEAQYIGGSASSWTDSTADIEQKGALWVTTLTGLNDGTTYRRLRVRAVNTADVAGQWSNVEWAKTRAALQKAGLIPESRHQIHKDEDVEEDVGLGGRGSIGVNWINREFSPCVTFEVQYKGGSITDWTDHPVSIYNSSGGIEVPVKVNITGLDDGTWYDLRLRHVTYEDAPCEGGTVGPWSDVVRAPTPQYGKPGIWFGQHGAPYSTERGILKVRWTQPSVWHFYNDPDSTYFGHFRSDMRYRKSGETSWTDELTTHEWTSYELTGLDDSTTYEFQVRARNETDTSSDPTYWMDPGPM